MKAFYKHIDPNRYFVVKVKPRANLFQDVAPHDEMQMFANLLRYFIEKKKDTRLIPYLE